MSHSNLDGNLWRTKACGSAVAADTLLDDDDDDDDDDDEEVDEVAPARILRLLVPSI